METLKKIPLVRMRGKIIKGFGRGSKMLGVPTANMEIKDRSIIEHTPAGIYAGWARIEGKPDVYKTVLSIGWNPFFKDIKEKIVVGAVNMHSSFATKFPTPLTIRVNI